jgi:zinc protease
MSVTLTSGLTPVRTVLDNGAVVLVQETSLSPAVTINAAFLAGGLYEPLELPGVAHLVGRVIDRGTTTRSADTIAEELDDRGVSLHVGTTRHLLVFSCTCLAEDFDDMLALVLDVARHPTFPEEELAKRRAETVTAIRQDEDNPAVRAVQSFYEVLYGATHPYGRRSKGTLQSVEQIDRSALLAFHGQRVSPPVLSLAIVGDVQAERAIDRAAAQLDGWSRPTPPRVDVPPPAVGVTRRVRVTEIPGKSQTDIAYGFATVSRFDPRYYAYWMMNHVLGQFGLGGRLAENIRERQGMAYYAFSTFDPSVGAGPLLIRAGVDPSNVERALEAIDQEVAAMASGGPTPRELEETRDHLIGSIPRMLETNPAIATFLQTAEQFRLGLDYDRKLPDLLRAVTMDHVRAAAAETLHPGRAVVAIAGPRPDERGQGAQP